MSKMHRTEGIIEKIHANIIHETDQTMNQSYTMYEGLKRIRFEKNFIMDVKYMGNYLYDEIQKEMQ